MVVVDRDSALRLLGLDGAATEQEIKKAFKKEVLRSHPDKHGGSDALFRSVLDAYELLTDKGRENGAGMGMGARHSARPWTGARRSWDPYAQARKEEAKYKQEGNWRWRQEEGYDPDDLEDVWSDIGYNPYTGQYYKPREHAKTADAGPGPRARATYRSASSSGQAARQSTYNPSAHLERESDGPSLSLNVMLSMALWIFVVALCAMRSMQVAAEVRPAIGHAMMGKYYARGPDDQMLPPVAYRGPAYDYGFEVFRPP